MKKPRSYADRKQAAFNAGKQAYKDGKKLTECPIQKHQGLQRSWREGFLASEADREKQTSGMYIARIPSAPAVMPSQPVAAHG